MRKIILKYDKIPDDILFDIVNRDAALWVADFTTGEAEQIGLLASLIILPWKVVLCELSDSRLVTEVERIGANEDELSRHRGFVHIVASDPSTRQLPARTLPVYLLNGRDDALDRSESSKLAGMAASRRKLNMIGQLEAALPKRIVVIGTNVDQVAEQLAELWEEEFRALITFVIPQNVSLDPVVAHFESIAGISSLSVVHSTLKDFAEYTVRRCYESLPDTKTVIRVRMPSGDRIEVDITNAELIEQPVFDKYEIIKSKDLRYVSIDDLTVEDFNNFFEKTQQSWRGYSAGLPWIAEPTCRKRLLDSLHKIHKEGASSNSLFYISSESGAGGSTVARSIAFEAASAGYPTLLAKPQVYEPNAIELSSFLYRALSNIRNALALGADNDNALDLETPWLIVFDRDQWEGQEDAIGSFLAELKRSGRPVVLLKVIGQFIPSEIFNIPDTSELCALTHQLTRDQVVALGNHLNRYLKRLGRTKGESDWIRFWEQHKPDIDTSIAAFWITLEFWLKELIDLGESIQSWIVRQFKEASLSREMRLRVLEIAALTTERRAIPEQLFPLPQEEKLPLSVILDDLRSDVPGLALIRQETSIGRFWAMAHDVLGRYLIHGLYHERSLLKELGFSELQSPVELRLNLISEVTHRSALGERRFIPYAEQFALNTLKLDDAEGNAEFFQFWREVLKILEGFPKSVVETSRTFNHHVAVSRRRVAKLEVFGASVQEKRTQLRQAIGQIEFALTKLEEKQDDESNLNLFNSLALAYQDLAALEMEQGGSVELVRDLRNKAHAATLNALRENPASPFVLETAAKNLLQRGQLDQNEIVSSAAEALGYIFQATTLENSGTRQHQLSRLANDALQRLNTAEAEAEIRSLIAAGNPFGFLASAWLELTKGQDTITAAIPSAFSEASMRNALNILSTAPRSWILIRLQYDLLSALETHNFSSQLDLLDELDSFPSYNMPLQLRLERSILLHMIGRHPDANSSFRALRSDIKRQNAIVVVPERLKWLIGPDHRTRLLCNARVTDDLGYRPMAQVAELRNIPVPFIAQEFGKQRMLPRQSFRCHITFGAMGPFIKAPVLPRN